MPGGPKKFTNNDKNYLHPFLHEKKDTNLWAEFFHAQKQQQVKATNIPLTPGSWDHFTTNLTEDFSFKHTEQDTLQDLTQLFKTKDVSAKEHTVPFKLVWPGV